MFIRQFFSFLISIYSIKIAIITIKNIISIKTTEFSENWTAVKKVSANVVQQYIINNEGSDGKLLKIYSNCTINSVSREISCFNVKKFDIFRRSQNKSIIL